MKSRNLVIKNISYLFQSILIYFFFLIGFILGIKISRTLFAFLFSVIGPIFRSREIIDKNIEIFSSKASNINKQKISSQMWKNYGMTFIEYIFLKKFRFNESHIKIKGKENIYENLKNNKPVIFVSGHFANFELMAMEITKMNIKLASIYRPLNNKFLNPFMEHIREKYVCNKQIKKGINGVREVIDYLKKDYSIALMIDQRVSEGEKINFFGKEALTTTLPAQLAKKYNLDIIPVYIERVKNNNFLIEFQKPLSPKNFGNKLEISKELNKVLEKMILKNPGQWIWSHNRWK
tara:strand:+ start:2965 stop:3840 length:876 start_codon:yes stop_codon:yes gene_type:complete